MNQSILLLDVSTHALLHLQFKAREKRLTVSERNQLLVHFLKRKIKSSRYRSIKKQTKQWLFLARKHGVNFESMLAQEQSKLFQQCSTDIHHFVELVSKIESKLRTKVQYSLAKELDLNSRYGDVLICVIDKDLSSRFDEDGLMLKSTQILLVGDSDQQAEFSDVLDCSGYFQSVVAYQDDYHLRVEMFRL
ncbi:hypothetical protein MACH09_45280 [Vibrio sp. MACH09]|uniref:DUF2913 family protein n=1 Tax=Vibrio sp. MACH09 TaxID=3025122 RepID=UPI002793CDF2|nr:DUF2913 family protein [Vibrio sp. MACH09]GLO64020.1 hypothetical protein MACH09_45280 [Vibrio sp. MACH09]